MVSRARPAPFRGRHFADVIIILCVRWLWFANIRFADSSLTFIRYGPKIEAYADPRPVPVSFCATPLQRSCGRRGGECGSSPSTRGLPATTKTTGSDFPRPTVLVGTLPAVEALALSPDVRPSRHRRPLAARAISQVLGTFIEKEPASPRETRDGRSDSTSD